MQIQLNGETREIADQSTVEALIALLDLEPARVAIELNRNVVRRQDWTETTLHDGDRVEIVHFVGGGLEEQKSEVRSQRSEVRGQKSEVRSQRSEVRGQRSEVRSQKSDVTLDVRSQM